eukprot:994496_1
MAVDLRLLCGWSTERLVASAAHSCARGGSARAEWYREFGGRTDVGRWWWYADERITLPSPSIIFPPPVFLSSRARTTLPDCMLRRAAFVNTCCGFADEACVTCVSGREW